MHSITQSSLLSPFSNNWTGLSQLQRFLNFHLLLNCFVPNIGVAGCIVLIVKRVSVDCRSFVGKPKLSTETELLLPCKL